MSKLSGLQVALVGIIMMILRSYNIGIPENEVITVVAGLLAVGGVVWDWYKGFRNGTLSLGGFKK